MSNTPKDDDFGIPDENVDLSEDLSAEEAAEIEATEAFADVSESAESEEEVEEVDDDAAGQSDEEVVAVADEDESEEDDIEEEQPEPGLSTAGQYLAASSIAFVVLLVLLAISILVLGRVPLEAGFAMIAIPISLVCLACSIVGLLAKPRKRERLLLIPTLGPLLPLAAVILFVIAMIDELSG